MRALVAAVALAIIASCGGRPPVKLNDRWPDSPRGYDKVTEAWTRSDTLIHKWDRLMDVHATFLSPEWRAAYVRRRAQIEALSAKEREALMESQRKTHAEFWEIHLRVNTYNRDENDLSRPNSSWRVALFDDTGRQVTPVDIKRDRRPRPVIESWFPDIGDFDEAYVARFPRTIPVLRDGAQKVVLRISGGRGAVVLVWK